LLDAAPRCGVWARKTLAEADGPLRVREIHQATQKLAGTPLSWNTVKDCLHTNAPADPTAPNRVVHSRYRHL
jgi:hypothetical protein